MTSTQTDLLNEVRELVRAGIERGKVLTASLIADEIIRSHEDDRDFIQLCIAGHVRVAVRKGLGMEFKRDSEPDGQMLLPGYEHIRRAYLIERDDVQKIVPIEQIADEELEEKIREYRTMGKGCFAHADELERYLRKRLTA